MATTFTRRQLLRRARWVWWLRSKRPGWNYAEIARLERALGYEPSVTPVPVEERLQAAAERGFLGFGKLPKDRCLTTRSHMLESLVVA